MSWRLGAGHLRVESGGFGTKQTENRNSVHVLPTGTPYLPELRQVIQHQHLPYGCRWIVPKSYKNAPRHCVRLYRDLLDRMSESQFDFFPYPFNTLPHICVDDIQLWAYEGMLIFCNMAERHYPDRFLRQYYIMFDIPQDAKQGNDHHTSRSAVSTSVLTM
ncbi:unnamed protein product [Cuscuta epithymum]|uniref:Aminotransferase-like plant mobile domain-containing protein n=1 Tax=Cuscuta epithymum TaxID=186058 RepID=A0AAV0EQH8_9ASTE|nr:unnamed protein product [Cuscuta epithymum]